MEVQIVAKEMESATVAGGMPDQTPLDPILLSESRRVLLINNIINQLEIESRVLLSIFYNNGGTINAVPAETPAVDLSKNPMDTVPSDLPTQWKTIRTLCLTLSELDPSRSVELGPQLFVLRQLIDKASSESSEKTPSANVFHVPFAVLKLLSISKRAANKMLSAIRSHTGLTEEHLKDAAAPIHGASVRMQKYLSQRVMGIYGATSSSTMDMVSVLDLAASSDVLRQRPGRAVTLSTAEVLSQIAVSTSAGFRQRSASVDTESDQFASLGPSKNLKQFKRDMTLTVEESDDSDAETRASTKHRHSIDTSSVRSSIKMAADENAEPLRPESRLSRKKTLLNKISMNKTASQKNLPSGSQDSNGSESEFARDLNTLARSLDTSSDLKTGSPSESYPSSKEEVSSPTSVSTILRNNQSESPQVPTINLVPSWRPNHVILLPINDLVEPTRFGRSNTKRNPFFRTFDSQVVSRSHLEIWREGDQIFVKDIGSNGGTFLNGKRLSESGQISEPHLLRSGDYIQIGKDFFSDADPGVPVQVLTKDAKETGPQHPFWHWKRVPEIPDDMMFYQKKHRCIKIQVALLNESDLQSIVSPSSSIRTEFNDTGSKENVLEASKISLVDGKRQPLVINTAELNGQYRPNVPYPHFNQYPPQTSTSSANSLLLPIPSIFSAPPVTSEYQKTLEAQKREIERQLEEQQVKMQRELRQLTNAFSVGEMVVAQPEDEAEAETKVVKTGRKPSLSFSLSHLTSIPSFVSPKSATLPSKRRESTQQASLSPAAPTQTSNIPSIAASTTTSFNPRTRRVKMVVTTTFSGSKIKKATLQAQGCDSDLFTVDLKRWEGQRVLTLTDLRPRFFSTAEITISSKSNPKEYAVEGKSPMTQLTTLMGTIVQSSDIKIDIHPTSTSPVTNPSSFNTTAAENSSITYTLSGDFSSAKFIAIQKRSSAQSREQRLIGEAPGKRLARKSVRESRWTSEVELEEGDEASKGGMFVECPQLLMAAILFVHVIGGNSS
ncbi:hypothetical protein HDU97_005828 [Phlyctochytrium planicorne]|nr:hypothetical protein HDU97_005828 [Phlyctochytrium planicorne]